MLAFIRLHHHNGDVREEVGVVYIYGVDELANPRASKAASSSNLPVSKHRLQDFIDRNTGPLPSFLSSSSNSTPFANAFITYIRLIPAAPSVSRATSLRKGPYTSVLHTPSILLASLLDATGFCTSTRASSVSPCHALTPGDLFTMSCSGNLKWTDPGRMTFPDQRHSFL